MRARARAAYLEVAEVPMNIPEHVTRLLQLEHCSFLRHHVRCCPQHDFHVTAPH
jgi:hypothetical protein